MDFIPFVGYFSPEGRKITYKRRKVPCCRRLLLPLVRPAVERWVLFASILASSMAFIDGSALNVALPSLQADLQASGAQLLWIVNAYLLMLAALILVGGSLGDKLGRKQIFMIGIGLVGSRLVAPARSRQL
jgi:hypothetical protein